MILQQNITLFYSILTSHQKCEWFFRLFSSQTREKVILLLISVGTSIDNLVPSKTEIGKHSALNIHYQDPIMKHIVYEIKEAYII
jgi:hypothetical protein